MPVVEGGTRLRQLLEDPNHLIVCPGVYDGLSARIAISMGFEAIYMVIYNQNRTYSLTTLADYS